MTTMEAARHAVGSLPQPYPSLPASPTLTNPDMILPDYDRASSPGGLDDQDLRAQSPLTMWKNTHATSSDLEHMYTAPPQQLHNFPAGPITPTTPIIYGNGTMLSDIGEVTEVESTVGKPSPSRSIRQIINRPSLSIKDRGSGSDLDATLRSSPTIGFTSGLGGLKKRAKETQRERRSSIDSNSTITTQDHAGLFADFDDTVSVGDSVFQGDDEESLASSYVPEEAPPLEVNKPERLADSIGGGVASNGGSRYSTASLSRRAEEILANAKRRLTTMEGNLNRARSSLYIASTSSVGSDASTPSPPIVRAATAFNLTTDPSSPNSSQGHSRKGSDNSLRIGLPVNVYPQRSASALGAAGGYRQPLTGSKSVDHLHGQYNRPSVQGSLSIREIALEPLSEDEVSPATRSNGSSEDRQVKVDNYLSPTFGSYSDRGLTRSASVAQMRDIKDQVKDLKGKISSLREQARADSLKRRSLQSLRTPSPFTHAQVDQWYAEPNVPNGPGSGSGGNGSTGRNPWNGELSSVDGDDVEDVPKEAPRGSEDEDSSISGYEEPDAAITQLGHPSRRLDVNELEGPIAEEVEEDDDDMQTENGDVEDEEDAVPAPIDDGYQSESGESLYHDTVQQQVSHEDREDAFDYEHFFLHSAMGTISQQRLARKASRGSFSSEDSVETTRGPTISSNRTESASRSRSRRNSSASTSTMDSFATAEEGRASRHGSGGSGSGREESADDYPEQAVTVPTKRSDSPVTARRATFSNATLTNGHRSSLEEQRTPQAQAMAPAARRPMSTSATMLHRPSVSSFESTGTNRSFPLVKKTKKASSTGIITPHGASPDQDLKTISDSLMNETASIYEEARMNGHESALDNGSHKYSGSLDSANGVGTLDGQVADSNAAAMQTLLREDQYLVERLVASLGRCVLGLTDSGRASTESRMYRRRIDAARRILEGLEPV
ncbi:2-oxoacid dehydrogenase acyltransferase protein [Pleurostoma richardsiae]|uniref:2-oxoacid dehydrogenase acyltransferase protein n=1 Tax=Pleurostoma richardsiae TaxID=41990 RepID=A0AA38RKA9_9PEZI|nr:2-oxoacid dehydrogenase acyltransferase protein [Pleurostoma richardsiae]